MDASLAQQEGIVGLIDNSNVFISGKRIEARRKGFTTQEDERWCAAHPDSSCMMVAV